jgi:hypothetical protein
MLVDFQDLQCRNYDQGFPAVPDPVGDDIRPSDQSKSES